jgi:active breakpoint cluster region-related protein
MELSISDSYEAEQLLKEVDIHSVTGILKSYLRELPGKVFVLRSLVNS